MEKAARNDGQQRSQRLQGVRNGSIPTPSNFLLPFVAYCTLGPRVLYSIFIHTINLFGNLSSSGLSDDSVAVNLEQSMLSLIYAIALGLADVR